MEQVDVSVWADKGTATETAGFVWRRKTAGVNDRKELRWR